MTFLLTTHRYTSQFEINSSATVLSNNHSTLSITFGRGGVGGNAAADTCGGWWLDNVGAELDAPNEWWWDRSSETIYYINNGTTAVPSQNTTFVALTRQVMVNITGVTGSLTFRGLRFAGAAHTFLASHGVPSVRLETLYFE